MRHAKGHQIILNLGGDDVLFLKRSLWALTAYVPFLYAISTSNCWANICFSVQTQPRVARALYYQGGITLASVSHQ